MGEIILNPQQQAAVKHTDGPLLVIAGAGSGKTRVITEKIAHLIDDVKLPAARIAAITFTNKAAREMRERVAARLDAKKTRGLTVCTFHALGLRMVQSDPEAVGLRPGFSIFDPQDTAGVLREIMGAGVAPEDIDAARNQISNWKNAAVDPAHAQAGAEDERSARNARVFETYAARLQKFNAMDFDDLILRPLLLLRDNDSARTTWREKLRYVLVDEYQDTNGAQYELLKLLCGPRGALTAVGDDDQSIYGWRGAQPENLTQLGRDYPKLRVIKLEQNYRSTNTILELANGLISRNDKQFEKTLWSELGHGDQARILACSTDEAEAEKVVSELLHRHFTGSQNWGDFAILYRSNHQARIFEKLLRTHRVPYHLSGGQAFFDRVEIKDLMSYFRLLANPDDDSAFLRVANVPRREIGAGTLEKLAALAAEQGVSLFEAGTMTHLVQERLPARGANAVSTFTRWLVELSDRGERGNPISAIEDLVEESCYRQWLRDQANDEKQAERRCQNVDELLDWLKRLYEAGDTNAGLSDLLTRLALMTGLDREDEPEGSLRLMTMHAAKGLEFPYVFIVGCEEGILPHRSSIDSGDDQEERRLFYVGITRAQRALCLSYARERRRFGETQQCEPSRFLSELPTHRITWEGRDVDTDRSHAKERADAHRESLRAMFDAF